MLCSGDFLLAAENVTKLREIYAFGYRRDKVELKHI